MSNAHGNGQNVQEIFNFFHVCVEFAPILVHNSDAHFMIFGQNGQEILVFSMIDD